MERTLTPNMGGMPGMKLNLVRTAGVVIGIIMTILNLAVFYPLGLEALYGEPNVLVVGPILMFILTYLLFKSDLVADLFKKEWEFGDEKRPLLIALAVIGTLGLQLALTLNIADWDAFIVFELPVVLSFFALTIQIHYTLTIYKNEKLRYYLGATVFIILWLIGMIPLIGALAIISPIFIAIALVIVFMAEKKLIAKKLMNLI